MTSSSDGRFKDTLREKGGGYVHLLPCRIGGKIQGVFCCINRILILLGSVLLCYDITYPRTHKKGREIDGDKHVNIHKYIEAYH